jgi:hypothetical protein
MAIFFALCPVVHSILALLRSRAKTARSSLYGSSSSGRLASHRSHPKLKKVIFICFSVYYLRRL